MAKGFGKSVTNNKLSRYAPLTKGNKVLIRGLEKLTDCKHGEDFILNNRVTRIYAKRKVIRALNELQSELDSVTHASTLGVIQGILEVTEVTSSIEESEFSLLMTEAFTWYCYKLLHDGNEPRIEKDLCFYTQEEVNKISKKLEEIAPVGDKIEDSLDLVVLPFLKYLKSQGYFYYLTHHTMNIPD